MNERDPPPRTPLVACQRAKSYFYGAISRRAYWDNWNSACQH